MDADATATFHDELLAIAALIGRHPDEFADLLAGISTTIRLSEHRAAHLGARGLRSRR